MVVERDVVGWRRRDSFEVGDNYGHMIMYSGSCSLCWHGVTSLCIIYSLFFVPYVWPGFVESLVSGSFTVRRDTGNYGRIGFSGIFW